MKALIFDVGGVVHSLDGNGCETVRKLAGWRKPILHYSALMATIRQFGRGETTEDVFWQKIGDKLGVKLPDNAGLMLRQEFASKTVVYSEVIALLEELRRRGYYIYALSNTIPPHAEILRETGVYAHFNEAFLSYETGWRKPDLGAYHYVLGAIGLLPQEVVFVDDQKVNLKPAQELGMKTILATSPCRTTQDVRALLGMSLIQRG